MIVSMSKKRTRDQKENARHSLYSWTPNHHLEARVKRESKIEAKIDYPKDTAKKDIIRSLIIASLILSLEAVIYLGWIKLMP